MSGSSAQLWYYTHKLALGLERSTNNGSSESFELNVGLHQRSLLSTLLFSVVMDIDVVSSKKKNSNKRQ